MPTWPRDKLLRDSPELPMAERVRRYQNNILTIRESGCAIPTAAYVGTLDRVEIEMWFLDNAERKQRLKAAIRGLAGIAKSPIAIEPQGAGERAQSRYSPSDDRRWARSRPA